MSDGDDGALPEPLTPSGCSMQRVREMRLDVVRLANSTLWSLPNHQAALAGFKLMVASWHQVPSGSIPDDDGLLCSLAGLGQDVRKWMSIRNDALREFVRCSDGRLYHPAVSDSVIASLSLSHSARDRKRRQREREKEGDKSLIRLVGGTDVAQTSAAIPHRCHGDVVPAPEGRHRDIVTDAQEGHGDVAARPQRCHGDVTVTSHQLARGRGEGRKEASKQKKGSWDIESTIPRAGAYWRTRARQPDADIDFVRTHVELDGKGQRRCNGFLMAAVEEEVFTAAGIDPTKTPISTAMIARWLMQGIRPDDINDAVWARTRKADYVIPNDLRYFDGFVQFEHQKRLAGKKL